MTLIIIYVPILHLDNTMNKKCNKTKLNFERRDSERLRDQGVEKRPIDPKHSALRNKSLRTSTSTERTIEH